MPVTPKPLLDLSGASKTIELASGTRMRVLDRVSLTVGTGESLAVLGRSGSGKSTLLGLLGLIDAPDDGASYRVLGRETVGLGDREMAHLRGAVFGFVYQRFCLMSHLSAEENVEAALLHAGVQRAKRRHAVSEALERVGLADRARHKPDQLSGGEQQRVAIARSLVRRPRVILADEPTGSLDVETGREVLDLMTRVVAESDAALVIVTHDLEIAAGLQRVVHISDGTLEDWTLREKRTQHRRPGGALAARA